MCTLLKAYYAGCVGFLSVNTTVSDSGERLSTVESSTLFLQNGGRPETSWTQQNTNTNKKIQAGGRVSADTHTSVVDQK